MRHFELSFWISSFSMVLFACTAIGSTKQSSGGALPESAKPTILVMDELPNRLASFDQAISDLQKENAEIKNNLARLQQENSALRKRLDVKGL